MTVSLVTNSRRSASFIGVLVLMVYLIFAMTLYLLPPRLPSEPRKTTENSIQRAFDVGEFTSLEGRSACCANFS